MKCVQWPAQADLSNALTFLLMSHHISWSFQRQRGKLFLSSNLSSSVHEYSPKYIHNVVIKDLLALLFLSSFPFGKPLVSFPMVYSFGQTVSIIQLRSHFTSYHSAEGGNAFLQRGETFLNAEKVYADGNLPHSSPVLCSKRLKLNYHSKTFTHSIN